MIIQVAVTQNDYAYQLNQKGMALKFYPSITLLSKALCLKGLLNQRIKLTEM